MNVVEFNIGVDLTKKEHINALSMFLKVVGGHAEETELFKSQEDKPVETPQPEKPKRKRRTKAEIEAAKAEEDSNEPPIMEEDKEGPQLSDVRKLLAEKIQLGDDIRDKCAAKMKELGAKNVSTLKAAKYQEFIDFLNSL